MKNVLSLALLFISLAGYAQEVQNVGIGTALPDKSAVLDIQSQNKGLLIPRLSLKQKEAIADPANGLLIYQTDAGKSGFFYFNGTKWTPLQDQNAVATVDANGWALDGNAITNSNKTAATASSFIGTPPGVPINFKIGSLDVGRITSSGEGIYLGINAGNPTAYEYSWSNIGIGKNALGAKTSTFRNVALGDNTLSNITVSGENIAIGFSVLRNAVQSTGNIGIGSSVFSNSSSSSYNVGIGSTTLINNNGTLNVAVGQQSLGIGSGSYNVAIGARTGFNKSGDRNVYIGYFAGGSGINEEYDKLYIANTSTPTPLLYGDFAAKFISIGDIPVEKRDSIATAGNYGLLVKNGILAERVKVALSSSSHWADYVFEEEYKKNMMSLDEVEKFTLKHKHLPNVPSATEMVENGLDVTETSRIFMEKIEELTLYLIGVNKDLTKKIEHLEEKIRVLEKK
jgi:hypothetical protein